MISLDQVLHLLLSYKYLVLFPIVVFEGPIVTVIAGFLATSGRLDPFISFPLIVAGDLVGDTIYYFLGKWGGNKFALKWGKFFGLNESRLKKVERLFSMHGKKTLILGKLSHAIGVVILFAAGVVKFPYLNFLLLNLVATVPKSLALLLFGFFFGQAYARINYYFDVTAVATVIIALLCLLIYFYIEKTARKYSKEEL